MFIAHSLESIVNDWNTMQVPCPVQGRIQDFKIEGAQRCAALITSARDEREARNPFNILEALRI